MWTFPSTVVLFFGMGRTFLHNGVEDTGEALFSYPGNPDIFFYCIAREIWGIRHVAWSGTAEVRIMQLPFLFFLIGAHNDYGFELFHLPLPFVLFVHVMMSYSIYPLWHITLSVLSVMGLSPRPTYGRLTDERFARARVYQKLNHHYVSPLLQCLYLLDHVLIY